MKPVEVTEINCCHAYCIAALLEIPFEEVPNYFKGSQNGELWNNRKQIKWLKNRGYGVVGVLWDKIVDGGMCPIIPEVYCIVSGKTPAGTMHAVICETTETTDEQGRDMTGYVLIYDCAQTNHSLDMVWPFIDKGIDTVEFLLPLTSKVYSGRLH